MLRWLLYDQLCLDCSGGGRDKEKGWGLARAYGVDVGELLEMLHVLDTYLS